MFLCTPTILMIHKTFMISGTCLQPLDIRRLQVKFRFDQIFASTLAQTWLFWWWFLFLVFLCRVVLCCVELCFVVLCVFFQLLSSSCVLCSQCWQCLWIVHSLLSLRFSLTFIQYYVCFSTFLHTPLEHYKN